MQYAVGQMKLSEKDITAYQQSVVSAVRFVIANRCELDSEMKISGGINLNAADMFKDSRDLIRFCNIVNQSAKDALLEMERKIVNILKQRRERSNDIQIKFDRTVSSRNPVHTELQRTGASEKADRQVGQNVAGVGENGVFQRGSYIRDGGSLEHNTEGNRQRSGETLSGDGRTASTAEPPSDSVQRDTDLGENKSADDRTQDNGGNRVQAQNVAVQNLIDRFLHADFNRRLDSYETAGMVFMDYADTSFDPVQFFDRFHSDRFSDTQAEEIRNIIKAAMQSREYVPKLVTELTDIQNYDLEQFEIFRSPVTHDVNGYYADDLAEGDTVKLDGELWTVKSAVTYSISLVNDSGEKNINNSPESKWQETITKAGFEFVPEKALEISEPVFAEPEPFYTQGEQLTFFGEPVPIEKTERKSKPKPTNIAVSHTAPTTDMVNHVLRGGSAEPRSLERIAAQFQKGKSVAENAEFLRKEFGKNGRGYKYVASDFGSSALVASWTDNTGITVAISNTAFPEGKNAHLEWSEAAERIGEMLENGEYC